jgi:hypothetical protein
MGTLLPSIQVLDSLAIVRTASPTAHSASDAGNMNRKKWREARGTI